MFSFKLRGAYNKMARLPRSALRRGVIAASAGQPRARRRARGAAARLPRDDRDAGHHAADQGRRGRRARRARSCCTATPTTTPTREAMRIGAAAQADLRASLRRPRRDRRAGHHRRWRSCASCREPIDAIFVAGRRRRADRGHRRLREAPPARDPHHRRRAGRRRRDDALAHGGPPRHARRTSASSPTASPCKQVGEETVPPAPQARRRDDPRRHRRDLRRDQGRVRGHARRSRAGRRAGGRRRQALRRARRRSRAQRWSRSLCGANMNFDRLRFVAERAELGEQREAMLAVTIPERPGSFKAFCAHARARATSPSSTTAIADPTEAHIFVGVERARRAGDRTSSCATLRARAASRRSTCPTTRWRSSTCATWSAGRAPAPERAALPLRVPRAPRRADALPRRDEPATGTSACSTTATTAPTTGACWRASRCRRGAPGVPEFLRSSATPTPTRRATPPARLFLGGEDRSGRWLLEKARSLLRSSRLSPSAIQGFASLDRGGAHRNRSFPGFRIHRAAWH